MTTVANEVHKSKWGYHPCSYEEFLELKEAHKLVLQAYRDVMRFVRWYRKDESNRYFKKVQVGAKGPQKLKTDDPIPEPVHADFLVNRWASGAIMLRGLEGCNLYVQILKVYQNARTPRPNPECVRFITLDDNAKELIKKLKGFYSDK